MSEDMEDYGVTDSEPEPERGPQVVAPSKVRRARKAVKKARAKDARTRKAAKAKATKHRIARSSGGRLLYRLAAATDPDKYKPESHAGATLRALKKLGEATSGEIVAQVRKDEKIETTMKELPTAITFILWKLKGEKRLLTRPKAKVAA